MTHAILTMETKTRGRRAPSQILFAALVAAAALAAGESCSLRAQEAGARLESARTALEKTVETRRILSKERRDWKVGKELLDQRIALVGRENEALRERIVGAEASISEADKSKLELVEANDRLKAAAAGLAEGIVAVEARTRALLARLPGMLRDRVKPLSQRIPDPAATEPTKLSLSERFQNVVGILNEVNKFQREITMASEVRELSDGTSVAVTALYVGIGQGYYVNEKGTIAGIGTSTAEGWQWRPANDAAPAIARTIAILENKEAASFVPLPIRIEKGAAQKEAGR
jgi:hypothetical protein